MKHLKHYVELHCLNCESYPEFVQQQLHRRSSSTFYNLHCMSGHRNSHSDNTLLHGLDSRHHDQGNPHHSLHQDIWHLQLHLSPLLNSRMPPLRRPKGTWPAGLGSVLPFSNPSFNSKL
uniref:Uncharacterized protein n=1 Tax=Glycine max TaxID=3847 RepID=C6SW01_SOYBN|nr:unknown [Glycine max]